MASVTTSNGNRHDLSDLTRDQVDLYRLDLVGLIEDAGGDTSRAGVAFMVELVEAIDRERARRAEALVNDLAERILAAPRADLEPLRAKHRAAVQAMQQARRYVEGGR